MNVRFIISEEYNFFFFIQTLADWHFSCRSQYIRSWFCELGPLTKQENEALAAFGSVMRKYDFASSEDHEAMNAFDFFMRIEEMETPGPFSQQEIDVFHLAQKLLRNKFHKIWEREKKKLKSVESALNESFCRTQAGVHNDLKTLFGKYIGASALDNDMEVILLLSVEGIVAGGANNGPGIITLECSSAKPQDISYLLSTLWHEATHLFLGAYIEQAALLTENSDIIKEAAFEAKKRGFSYAKELLVYSIFSPVSFLTSKHFATEAARRLHDVAANQNTGRLLEERFVFIAYLIYLNGEFIRKKLQKRVGIMPGEMANALIENHRAVKKFFAANDKAPVWFIYE